jgi:hypothetical protein
MPNKQCVALAEKLAEKILAQLNELRFFPSNFKTGRENDKQVDRRRKDLDDARKEAGVSELGALKKADIYEDITKAAGLPIKKKVGACAELAALAYTEYSQIKQFDRVYIFMAPHKEKKNDYHAYVVLCLKQDPSDVMDFGDNNDIIIVDLWMDYCYPGMGPVVTGSEHQEQLEYSDYNLAKSQPFYPRVQ